MVGVKFLSRLRSRLSTATGVAGAYRRLDQLDEQVQHLFRLAENANAALSRATDKERAVYRTITLVQEQIIRDLRAEMRAYDDFAVERAVEIGQRDLNRAQDQLIRDLRAEVVSQHQASVDLSQAEIQGLRSEVTAELASVRRSLRSIEISGARETDGPRERVRHDPAQPSPVGSIPSDLYAGIEDVFRGDSEALRGRQADYIPLLGRVSEANPLLDLGCGRGEWLQELSARHMPASGVDSNELFVDQCRKSGLSVERGDIFERLDAQPDESLGAITLFQVLEHLPFMSMVRLINQACRTLIPGGVLIAEVPNSKNLRVGSGTFWIDPTHERPWYPELLEFLARQAGFSEVSGKYTNPLAPDPDLSDLPESIRSVIGSLCVAINGPADYALVARR